jgi:dihydroflavonol-4-reductase
MKHLIFGATGLVGAQLAESLALRGEEVYAFCRPGSEAEVLRGLGVRPVAGDLLDEESIRRAVGGMDNVYNCAAAAGGAASRLQAVNVLAVNAIILACRGKQVNRIVHLSCASVHGSERGMPLDEDAPFHPADDYARSKVEAERVVAAYLGQPDLRITTLRLAVPVGPDDTKIVGPLMEAFRLDRRAFSADAASPAVSFVDVRDAARAAILASTDDRAIGRTYLVRSFDATPSAFAAAVARAIGVASPAGRRVSKAWAARLLGRLMGGSERLSRVLDELARCPRVSDERIRRELGFLPEHDLESTAAHIARAYWEREIERFGRSRP